MVLPDGDGSLLSLIRRRAQMDSEGLWKQLLVLLLTHLFITYVAGAVLLTGRVGAWTVGHAQRSRLPVTLR